MRECRTADSSEAQSFEANGALPLRDPADRAALLWILGSKQGSRPQSARLVPSRPSRPSSSRPCRPNSSAKPIHNPGNHGGYRAPPRTRRGAPPTWPEQPKDVKKPVRPHSSRAEKPKQDLALLEMPPEGEPVGSQCSFWGRIKGRRVLDSGAMVLETKAEKCSRLILGTPAEAGPPKKIEEHKIQASIPRPVCAPGESASEAWARRNKAANIIASLHERKFFAEIKAHLERKAVDELPPELGGFQERARETPAEIRRKELLRRRQDQEEVRKRNTLQNPTDVQVASLPASSGIVVFVQVVKANLQFRDGTDTFCVAEILGKDVKRQMAIPQRTTASVRNEEMELGFVESTDVISLKIFQRDNLLGSASVKGSKIASRQDFKEDINIILKKEEDLQTLFAQHVQGTAAGEAHGEAASVTVRIKVAGQSEKESRRSGMPDFLEAVQETHVDISEHQEPRANSDGSGSFSSSTFEGGCGL